MPFSPAFPPVLVEAHDSCQDNAADETTPKHIHQSKLMIKFGICLQTGVNPQRSAILSPPCSDFDRLATGNYQLRPWLLHAQSGKIDMRIANSVIHESVTSLFVERHYGTPERSGRT